MITSRSICQEYIPLDPLFIKYYKGDISLEALYRNRQQSAFDETANQILYKGNFKFSTSAFIWEPNFIAFDLNGEYSPSINPTKYIALPEMTDNMNTNSLDGQVAIFNSLPINLNLFGNMNNTIMSREFGEKIQSIMQGYGASSSFMNSILPLTASYSKQISTQKDLISSYNYSSTIDQINATASRDILDFMSNSINMSYQKVRTQYFDSVGYKNNILDVSLSNNLGLPNGFIQLNSNTAFTDSKGDFNNKRLNEMLNLNVALPYRFKLNGRYNYLKNAIDSTENVIHSPMIQLQHQLYSNLNSRIFYEYLNSAQSTSGVKNYDEVDHIYGCTFDYTKRIPTGRFGLGYSFKKNNLSRNNESSSLSIRNEEYLLEDAKQTLLKYPNVIESSIIIKDVTGTLIFQKNIDYMIVLVNNFFQILRIPTGRIPDKSTVYIDYIPEVPDRYKYDMLSQSANASLSIFNGMLSLYFRFSENKFNNPEIQNINLLRIEQIKAGGFNLNLGRLSASGNYSVINSNISPYSTLDFYCSYYDNIWEGFSTNIYATLSDQKYYQTGQHNINGNVNLSFVYNLSSWMYANVQSNYSYAKIIDINLSYLNTRAELKMRYYETLFSFGFNYYHQRYETSNTNYIGMYLRLERSFGYF